MSVCKHCKKRIVWLKIGSQKIAVDHEEVNFVRNKYGSIRALCQDWEIHRGYIVGDANEDGYETARPVHWSVCKGERE